MNRLDWEHELETAVTAARAAGEAVLDLYDRAAAETYTKGDGSPVTDADLAADRIIRAHLTSAFPDDAILTEEGADDRDRLGRRRVWVVDPIDGTLQFVARTGEFDVLIALVVEGRPVVGVLLQPTTGRYLAAAEGGGAWVGQGDDRRPLRLVPLADGRPPRVATSIWLGAPDSLSMLAAVAQRLGSAPVEVTDLGVYPRHFVQKDRNHDVLIGVPSRPDGTMAWEWDFAAADVVMREAGGGFSDLSGEPHRYNKPVPRNDGGLLVSVDPATHARMLAAVAAEAG